MKIIIISLSLVTHPVRFNHEELAKKMTTYARATQAARGGESKPIICTVHSLLAALPKRYLNMGGSQNALRRRLEDNRKYLGGMPNVN